MIAEACGGAPPPGSGGFGRWISKVSGSRGANGAGESRGTAGGQSVHRAGPHRPPIIMSNTALRTRVAMICGMVCGSHCGPSPSPPFFPLFPPSPLSPPPPPPSDLVSVLGASLAAAPGVAFGPCSPFGKKLSKPFGGSPLCSSAGMSRGSSCDCCGSSAAVRWTMSCRNSRPRAAGSREKHRDRCPSSDPWCKVSLNGCAVTRPLRASVAAAAPNRRESESGMALRGAIVRPLAAPAT
jgi:hypothetical protein